MAASSFAFQLLLAGSACMVHAVLPFLFVHTGSDCVSRLHQQMLVRRAARARPAIERSAHQ